MFNARLRIFLPWLAATAALVVVSLVASPTTLAQVSVSTGGVSGTVTDPQGATIPNAKVTISNKQTGTNQNLETGSAGSFSTGGLSPANYTIRVEAKGFKTFQITVPVQVGQIATVNAILELGDSMSVIEVTGSAIHVNSEQASVQDVLPRRHRSVPREWPQLP